MSYDKIVKTMGHCVDGCGWQFCDFYLVSANGSGSRNSEIESLSRNMKAYCKLFGMAEKFSSESLEVCNKIYGRNYEGKT